MTFPTFWTVKKFKTPESGRAWVAKYANQIQWQEIYVNNVAFAIEYKALRKVY